MHLHRTLYVSESVGIAGTSLLSLAEILGESESKNRRNGLTSALMRHDGQFLQVIEGHRFDIDRLMDRLRLDARHKNLRILLDQPVSTRRFGAWPMILAEVNPAVARLLKGDTLDQLSPPRAEAVLAAAVGLDSAST